MVTWCDPLGLFRQLFGGSPREWKRYERAQKKLAQFHKNIFWPMGWIISILIEEFREES